MPTSLAPPPPFFNAVPQLVPNSFRSVCRIIRAHDTHDKAAIIGLAPPFLLSQRNPQDNLEAPALGVDSYCCHRLGNARILDRQSCAEPDMPRKNQPERWFVGG